jgi:hypothetical protein
VIQLIFTSKAVTPFVPVDLLAMLHAARARNARIGVTGMLLHVDGAYLQVLEGRSAAVHSLLARIRADRRHAQFVMLLVRDLEHRDFDGLAFFDGTGCAAALPGHRAATGFADLAGDPTTLLQLVASFRDGRRCALAA